MQAIGTNIILQVGSPGSKEDNFEKVNDIYVPLSAQKTSPFQTATVISIGEQVKNIAKGQQVLIHKNYISTLSIIDEEKKYYVVDNQHVQVVIPAKE